MRFGRSATFLSLSILAAVCVSAPNAAAQTVEPGLSNGGCVRQATYEGAPVPTLAESWAQGLRFEYQTQLAQLAARWFAPARLQPVIGQKAVVPSRLSAAWRKRS